MKQKSRIPAFIIVLIIAYSNLAINTAQAQTVTKKTSTVTHVKKTVITKKSGGADIAEGKALISKSDCLACHKLDVKLVGPAYADVAKKYPSTPANVTMLANKVIKGGTGVWGQIPMTPYPTLALADAKKMVKYVLSLK